MNAKTHRALVLGAFALVFLFCQTGFTQAPSPQESNLKIRQMMTVLPAYRRCEPVEVSATSFGKQPLEVVLGQVTVINRSEKTVTAVKLGWKVYRNKEGIDVAMRACDAPPPTAEVLFAGSTSMIQTEALAPKETCHISIKPLPVPVPATRTVFVEHPFITVDDLKFLAAEGQPQSGRYTAVIFVSEAYYSDGSSWVAVNN